jgi:alpha-galactosidase
MLPLKPIRLSACLAFTAFGALGAPAADLTSKILTPPPAPAPRINGPSVFGVRPGAPFLYTIPATGTRPVQFSADSLPSGLALDPGTGRITGSLAAPGQFAVVLKAANALGSATKKFRVVCGDTIALTPPMGWNSWNCWAGAVDQGKVLRSARALVASGLSQHGWTYINIDDTWQGPRNGPDHALEGNKKFPDMQGLVDQIHAMGLKAGIYSTPWETSYAGYPGGSSETDDGAFKKIGGKFGKIPRAKADAQQWAGWGFDYLKYDWNPIDVDHVREMSEALRATGRDIVFSLSNRADFTKAADYAQLANCWRTTGDIYDQWQNGEPDWHYSVSEIAFSQDRWAPYGGPGHWNDPDMLVVGQVGWGSSHHSSYLTADQQYTHISMWCLLSAPLLIGCDLEKLDPFTLNLLSNDEVLALDQDALGRPATRRATDGAIDVFVKELEDGSKAVGFFNRSGMNYSGRFTKLAAIGMGGKQQVRDLWRQKDLPEANGVIDINVPSDGVLLLRITPVHSGGG